MPLECIKFINYLSFRQKHILLQGSLIHKAKTKRFPLNEKRDRMFLDRWIEFSKKVTTSLSYYWWIFVTKVLVRRVDHASLSFCESDGNSHQKFVKCPENHATSLLYEFIKHLCQCLEYWNCSKKTESFLKTNVNLIIKHLNFYRDLTKQKYLNT